MTGRTFCYRGYPGVIGGCLLFDVMCWKIIKWCILKPIWFIIKSIFKLFRWIGKQLDILLKRESKLFEAILGWPCLFAEEFMKHYNDTKEDDLSFTPPEYENYVDESVESVETEEEIEEELPFCQLFPLGPDMCLMIDHVEMCPDETAFIRVVDEEGYTPLYKRKVRKDKRKERFIVFNNERYYLNDKKTKPIVPKKEP